MKILFSIDTWGLVGGTERHAAVVVPALLERGHAIEILTRDDQRPDFAAHLVEGEGLRVHELEFLSAKKLTPAQRARLTEVVRGVAPDVIFQQSNCNVAVIEMLTGLAPLVRYIHDHVIFCPGLNKFHRDGETCKGTLGTDCIERYYFKGGCVCLNRNQGRGILGPFSALFRQYREINVNRRATRLLTNSNYMKGELLKAGFGGEQVEVLNYFTLSNTQHQPKGPLDKATASFLDKDDLPLIFTPARLTHPDKGVDYLLTVLGKLEQPFKAIIAGSGPAEEWLHLKALEDGLGPDRLHWAGWQNSGAIETLLSKAAVLVCPSVWDEPFGLVGVEAMVHEKPVVAFNVGGIPEWLPDGEAGYLVPRCDTEAMKSAVDRLLADPELARRLGRQAAAFVHEAFPREKHLEKLERVLTEAARA